MATKRVDDAETAIKREQEDMINSENAELTTREPKRTLEEMMIVIGDSLSDLAISDNEEDRDD